MIDNGFERKREGRWIGDGHCGRYMDWISIWEQRGGGGVGDELEEEGLCGVAR